MSGYSSGALIQLADSTAEVAAVRISNVTAPAYDVALTIANSYIEGSWTFANLHLTSHISNSASSRFGDWT